jgi:hypothetical protein
MNIKFLAGTLSVLALVALQAAETQSPAPVTNGKPTNSRANGA